MNIENFPTSEAAKRMMGYITGNGFYDRSYVGKWIFQVMGIEMDEARRIIEDELPYQAFPETATWGLRYHEEKFGLPIRENLSPEERRKLILDRRDTKAPITPWRLEKMMNSVLGCDVKVVDIHEPDNKITHPNTFVVYLEGEGAFSLQKGIDKINDAKQSHTSYELHVRLAVFVLVENILFNRMTVRLPITWWGATWDGEHLFDGSIYFNARQPPFFRMAVPFEIPNIIKVENLRIVHRVVKISDYGDLLVKMVHRIPITWWGASFDGRYLFDGEALLNAVRPPDFRAVTYNLDADHAEGVLFEHTKISAVEIKNENECKIRDVHRASFLWTDYVITFDGELSFDGDETFSQESPPKIVSITHRMDAENVEDFGVVLYIPSKAARFNGVLNFDGTNNFNSGREDL
nr:MAG TPA: tail protein [Caudoviricetes sp.]